jgi:beta-N-acetylhexosaminidase
MKPAIVGLSGLELTVDEAACLAEHRPAGVILFARNVQDPKQLAPLMQALRAVLPENAVLMVDQEGGRVARLRPPHWRAHPSARAIGALGGQASVRAAWLTGALIGVECAAAGFDVVAAPVLDVGAPDGHDVIGDRAFAADPERVALLGRVFADGLLAGGVQPIGKHAPGHGRARADSHVELPVLDDVDAGDILPFARNVDLPWWMTAHILYRLRDGEHPATQSRLMIDGVIRAMGFDGVLVSDDLAMQALRGSPAERALAALAAGCDIALHCSGRIGDTRDILDNLGEAAPVTLERLAAAGLRAAASRLVLDAAALAEERDALMIAP